MNQWQEIKVLSKICKATEEQRERISEVLAELTEEDLCEELNVMLCKSGVMERKAKKRLGENNITKMGCIFDSFGNDYLSQEKFHKERTDRRLEKSVLLSLEYVYDDKSAEDRIQNPEQRFLIKEIFSQKQMTEQIKYTLHENRNAGIFASEMAKEWIDLQEDFLYKLQQYMVE